MADNLLAQRREQLGWSLAALAAAIPTTAARLRRVEQGRATLPPGLAARLALVLELTPYEALTHLGVDPIRSWTDAVLPPPALEVQRC
ncbi:MAG: helix-turn-helix transcriptional regulator [Deltaproteobacteria bacterium]|nr:helix-turn-helix transcriptional regulator [Deltaproteobacteria bacterium]